MLFIAIPLLTYSMTTCFYIFPVEFAYCQKDEETRIMTSIVIVSLCYSCLCVVYVFLYAATLTEVFPCFFLSCRENARVNLAKTGHGPHSHKLLCSSMYVLFVLCRSVYCLCVNVYCTTATGCQPNCS